MLDIEDHDIDIRDPVDGILEPGARPPSVRWRVTAEDKAKCDMRPPLVVTCSRRTDIPKAYLKPYLSRFEDEAIYVENPRTKIKHAVSLKPYDGATGVLAIVWWSKDYGKLIREFERADSPVHKYPIHMFQFTINSESQDLEPGVPPLEERLGQLRYLTNMHGPQAIKLRFDPIVHYAKRGEELDNLADFEKIIAFAGGIGLTSVTTSFCLPYANVTNRMAQKGYHLRTLGHYEKRDVLARLMAISHARGLQMQMCCESALIGYTPSDEVPPIAKSACVDGNALRALATAKRIECKLLGKDPGQRKECNCVIARDIGEYTLQCPHSCAYCYANPK